MAKSMAQKTVPVALMLVLAGCGGGGGGGGGGSGGSGALAPARAEGPGDMENFFPDDIGDSWTYTGLSSAGGDILGVFFDEITAIGEMRFGDAMATGFELLRHDPDATPRTMYFSKDSNAVTFRGSDPEDLLSTLLAPYRSAVFPLAPGQVSSSSRNGANLGEDLDGDGRNELVDISLVVRMSAFEPLVTSAGAFPRTARFVNSLDITIHGTAGGTAAGSIDETSWYAPAVGLVKRVTQSGDMPIMYDDRMELRGFETGGVRRGMGLPRLLTTGLRPSNSNTDYPGRPALASDGVNFLAITSRQTGVWITTPIVKFEGHLLDDEGNELRTFDISIPGPETSGRVDVDVAFGHGSYFTVFIDSTQERSLYLQRITTTGEVLDGPGGRLLADRPGTVAIAAGSNGFLVAFTRLTHFGDGRSEEHLYGLLLSATGAVQGTGEFPIATRTGNQSWPSIAFDGTNYLVVWQDTITGSGERDAFNIAGTRVTPAGAVLDPQYIEISSAPLEQSRPEVGFGEEQYLVVWQDARDSLPFKKFDVRAARVTPAGAVLDGSPASGGIVINAEPGIAKHHPTVSFAGDQFLTSWATLAPESVEGTNSGIHLARIRADGSLVPAPASGSVVSGKPPSATGTRYDWPNVVSGAGSSLVAWMSTGEDLGTAEPMSKSIHGVIVYAEVSE